MKITTWNCNGSFRKKIDNIISIKSDIYIIQECEKPEKYKEKLNELNLNFKWIGDNPNKGLGIFINNNYSINQLELNIEYRKRKLKWFLLVEINDNQKILAVWAHKNDANAFQYVGQFWLLMQQNIDIIKDTIIFWRF